MINGASDVPSSPFAAKNYRHDDGGTNMNRNKNGVAQTLIRGMQICMDRTTTTLTAPMTFGVRQEQQQARWVIRSCYHTHRFVSGVFGCSMSKMKTTRPPFGGSPSMSSSWIASNFCSSERLKGNGSRRNVRPTWSFIELSFIV